MNNEKLSEIRSEKIKFCEFFINNNILLKTNIGYAEYVGDINNTDAYRTNNEGDNIGNTNQKNVKNVSYSLITNFNNNSVRNTRFFLQNLTCISDFNTDFSVEFR